MTHTSGIEAPAGAGTVVKVGNGRGFLIHLDDQIAIVTAAHCLPCLPPARPASHAGERTYADLAGPLGAKPRIWAECVFADPIADLAVLVAPDDQELPDENAAYLAFTRSKPSFRIGTLERSSLVWLFSLTGRWIPCSAARSGGLAGLAHGVEVDGPPAAYEEGTSGSPIVVPDGCAIGLISVGRALNPLLAESLPPRILDACPM